MRKLIFLILISGYSLWANVEMEWEKIFGTEYWNYGHSIVASNDGGLLVGGQTYVGMSDGWIIKLDSNGNKEWDKTFGGDNGDSIESIIKSKSGGYIFAGYKSQSNIAYGWVVKIDDNGNIEWDKTFGESNTIKQIIETSDGGYSFIGYTSFSSGGNGNIDLWIGKIDGNGNLEWDETFGGSESDIGFSLDNVTDGGYIASGYTTSFGEGKTDILVVKFDSDGNLEWYKTFGTTISESSNSIIRTNDGGYVLIANVSRKTVDVQVMKLNSSGELEWSKSFGDGTSDDSALKIIKTMDGGYAFAGYSKSDGWIVKLDSNGDLEWDKTFDSVGKDYIYSIIQLDNGEFAFTGYTNEVFGGEPDIWVAKLKEENLTLSIPIFKTGQTKSYDENGSEIKDGSIKDDGYYQAGVSRSYSRDDINEIVTDNVTGLMWQDNEEVKTLTKPWSEAITYCDNLTFGSYSDWRLPSIEELESIVIVSKSNPAINDSFLNTQLNYYWSSNSCLYSTNSAWQVHFIYGNTTTYSKNNNASIRCVRGNEITKNFTRDNTLDVVIDNSNNLMWQDTPKATYETWSQAINYCKNLEFAGYSDWRLPNYNELLSIIDRTKFNPAINIAFLNTQLNYYWTSTTFVSNTSGANQMGFDYGLVSGALKNNHTYVRCVRVGDVNSAITTTSQNTPPTIKSFLLNKTSTYKGDTVVATINASDSDGDNLTYTYDFGDGSGFKNDNSHIYTTMGTFTIIAKVSDGKTETTKKTTITINEPTLVNEFENNESNNSNNNGGIEYETNSSYETQSQNIPPILYIRAMYPNSNTGLEKRYSFFAIAEDSDGYIASYHWSFGDGTFSNEINVGHTYTKEGDYNVTCIVTDNDGLTTTETLTISVSFIHNTTPPVLIINASKLQANIKESISFSSRARDGDGYIKSYYWSFGDGEFSNEENPIHSYKKEGNYTVACTVIDNSDKNSTETLNINITKDCGIPLNSANLFPKDSCSFKDEYEIGEEVEFIFKFNEYGDIRELPTVGSCKVLNSDVLNYSTSRKKIIFEENGIGMLVCAQNNIVIRIPFKVGNFELEPNNALIVVGKGSDNDKLKEAFKTLGNQVYQFLYSQGYRDDEIIYFNAFGEQKLVDLDFDGNSDNVVDSSSFDESDIKEAIENMPKSKNPILIYLIDHGKEGGGFMIDNDNTLTANDLKDTLDSIGSSREVIVVLDSCYSGEFVESLKGENRVIISSGTKDELIPMSDTGLSFTNYFLKNLQDRKTIKSSFENARDSYTKLVKNAHPQISFNSNITDSPFGYLYDKIDIIESYTKELNLSYPQSESLTLDVNEKGLIDKNGTKAYVIITPPQKIILDNKNNTNAIEIESEKKELSQKDGKFFLDYNFTREGVYQVYYEVIDITGDKYSTDTTTVRVGDLNKTIEYISELNVKDGWNLLALPSKTSLEKPNEYFNGSVYTYEDLEWDINLTTINYGIGFWLKSTINKSYQFEGEEYKPTLDNLNDWYLLGTGKNLNDGNFKSDDIVWVFRDEWIQTKSINKGEGFWIQRLIK